jgi:hypothetical protein
MSGAECGTGTQASKQEGEFAVLRDGVRSTVEEDCVRGKCEERALRQRVVRELRVLWEQLGRDGDTEVEELRAEAARLVDESRDLEDKYDVLLDMVLVEELDMQRQGRRRECEAHEWKAAPACAGAEAPLQWCAWCEAGCGLNEEEARAMAAGRVACGEWTEEYAAGQLESLAAGGCCGKEWSV